MTSRFDDSVDLTRDDLLAQLAAMHGKLATLAVIEQAKGALMATYGLTADKAFELLRFHSQTRNVKLRAIAAQLTARLSTNPTNSRATAQLDRLIDDVIRTLQTPVGTTVDALDQVDMASLWSQIAADRDTRVASRAGTVCATADPVAGNTPEHQRG